MGPELYFAYSFAHIRDHARLEDLYLHRCRTEGEEVNARGSCDCLLGSADYSINSPSVHEEWDTSQRYNRIDGKQNVMPKG